LSNVCEKGGGTHHGKRHGKANRGDRAGDNKEGGKKTGVHSATRFLTTGRKFSKPGERGGKIGPGAKMSFSKTKNKEAPGVDELKETT